MKLAIVIALGCAQPPPPHCPMPEPPDPHATHPLALGEQFALESKVLGERRVINVYVPPDYAKTDTKYPVLYMPDGGAAEDFPHISGVIDVSIRNDVIKPMLVVGIENTERRRDLVGVTDVEDEKKIAPHAGGSDKFRAFLRDELKPAIAARYRITSASAIVGESAAGLFVIETMLVDPALFDTYIAVDPSVWWNRRTLVEQAPIPDLTDKRLFVSTADYKETQDAVATLLSRLGDKPEVIYLPLPDEHHATIYPIASVKAFRVLFAAH